MNLGGTTVIRSNGIKAFITTDAWGRLKVGNRYIWVSFHSYCGPSFFYDSAMEKEYKFIEDYAKDPIWEIFNIWHEKYKVALNKHKTRKYDKL